MATKTSPHRKTEADNYYTNLLIFMNMNSKILGTLCTAITLFTLSDQALTAGSHIELTTKDHDICEIAPVTVLPGSSAVTEDPNAAGDNIIGDYIVEHKGEKSKVKVFKNADGSYTAQVFWVQNRTEKDGSVRKDVKNPDKSMRNVDCDKIVLFKGLRYDAQAKVWSGANIYDPVRGINASLKAWFSDSKTLSLKGSKMGFSETVTWTKL